MGIIKALLDAGANVKAKNNEGETALTLAAYTCDVESIKILFPPARR